MQYDKNQADKNQLADKFMCNAWKPATLPNALPPIPASYATPTPQMELLAAAATSPAHLVPCLQRERIPDG